MRPEFSPLSSQDVGWFRRHRSKQMNLRFDTELHRRLRPTNKLRRLPRQYSAVRCLGHVPRTKQSILIEVKKEY